MTSPLDEISFKLGEVSAGLAVLAGKAEKQERQNADIASSVNEIKTRIKPLADDVNWMKPQVRHYSGIRKRAAWIGSAIVGIGGVIGGAIADYVLRRFTGA